MKRLVLAAIAASLTFAAPARAQDANTLLNVSYDISRELYVAVNAEFAKAWKAKTGKDITINQSHAGSSKQARAILEGLEADVVTFNQVTDVQVLADRAAGLRRTGRSAFPNNASPYYSLPAFVVRAGNPKNIKNWDDLVRDDVKVVFPNPKTSGNAPLHLSRGLCVRAGEVRGRHRQGRRVHQEALVECRRCSTPAAVPRRRPSSSARSATC